RRADLSGKHYAFANILDFIDPKRFLLLPNTSGARNAAEAVRLARLAVAAGLPNWIKLEIHPDARYLLPDPVETLAAAEILVKEGFVVLPYINADPVLAKRLQDVGTATVMPLGSPIGSNRGIETRAQIEIVIEQATVPVVVDAGLGAPSQAAEAMEMGADAVLVNTAIAKAGDPVAMARAFKLAVEAGRAAFRAGVIPEQETAHASSPLGGVDMVQVRAKGMTDRELLPHLELARAVTRKYDVPFVVNDRVDLAGIVGADFVHLGQDDMPIPLAKRFGLGTGLSTHAPAEID